MITALEYGSQCFKIKYKWPYSDEITKPSGMNHSKLM